MPCGLVTEVPWTYPATFGALYINTDLLLYILLVENLTFRLWKVIVSLLIDDSVEVKDSMATSLCNITQSISEGKEHDCAFLIRDILSTYCTAPLRSSMAK